MKSHDYQPGQGYERSQVEISSGMCVHNCC